MTNENTPKPHGDGSQPTPSAINDHSNLLTDDLSFEFNPSGLNLNNAIGFTEPESELPWTFTPSGLNNSDGWFPSDWGLGDFDLPC